jgi:hypothetical protein
MNTAIWNSLDDQVAEDMAIQPDADLDTPCELTKSTRVLAHAIAMAIPGYQPGDRSIRVRDLSGQRVGTVDIVDDLRPLAANYVINTALAMENNFPQSRPSAVAAGAPPLSPPQLTPPPLPLEPTPQCLSAWCPHPPQGRPRSLAVRCTCVPPGRPDQATLPPVVTAGPEAPLEEDVDRELEFELEIEA